MKRISIAIALCAALTACTQFSANKNSTANSNAANTNSNAATANATPTIDPNLQATFPFKDFPAVETTAKAGEVVLVPSYLWLQQANVYGTDKTTMIWYAQKMSAPDKEMSEVEFMSEKRRVPNAYIVPIPAGATAKKGDILLTWWQSGSGMERAIVTNDATPSEPVVRYLDISYDNPAKGKDGRTGIGQMEERLKPNTFVKIRNPLEPGTSVAIQDGARMKHAQVIRMAGDKIFVIEFAGRIGVYDKGRCLPVPIVPSVKAGDRVQAMRYGAFTPAIVSRVDAGIGRVFVKFEAPPSEEAAIPFGNVMR